MEPIPATARTDGTGGDLGVNVRCTIETMRRLRCRLGLLHWCLMDAQPLARCIDAQAALGLPAVDPNGHPCGRGGN